MPLLDYLDNFIQEAQAQPLPVWELPAEPAYLYGNQRRLRQVDAPRPQQRRWQSKDEFRPHVQAEMRRYMAEPEPEHMLLIPAPPGSGKTWAGVEFAHWVYETMKHRVLYAGPRTDFYEDVINTVVDQNGNLNFWYDWKARRTDDENPDKHTCTHTDKINLWMDRGYPAMDFCVSVCGWDYINKTCPYHKQKERTEPLIYGNHNHVVLGHPLAKDFKVLIGDESPINTFVRKWTIPTKKIYSPNEEYGSSISMLLHEIQILCEEGKELHGRDLILVLDPERVQQACNDFSDPAPGSKVVVPTIHKADEADAVPMNFLPDLFSILRREIKAYLAGHDYPHRIWTGKTGLTLHTRRYVAPTMPKHVIWFDATGTADIYRNLFDRPVETVDAHIALEGKVYQVIDRSNGKGSLIRREDVKNENGDDVTILTQTNKTKQLIQQIYQIGERYKDPVVITFQALENEIRYRTGHFYGNRGTNFYKDCDAIIVAGTPMPPMNQIEQAAKCIFPERMRPFDINWYAVERQFNYVDADGQGFTYPVSQFADPELNIFLWQFREAEIIQAAHRARLLSRDVPVYLLTNLPLDELPPTRLLTIRELFGAPEGVDVFKWNDVAKFIDGRDFVTTADLVAGIGINREAVNKYLGIFVEMYGWEWATGIRRPGARGPAPKTIAKSK